MKFQNWISGNRFWIACFCFGAGTLALNTAAHLFPETVEQWYSRGLYQTLRSIFAHSLGYLPFAGFYLFWAGVVLFWWRQWRRRPSGQGRKTALTFWILRVAGFAGLLTGSFCWLWGFNYARVPLQEQLKLTSEPLDSVYLWHELASETRCLDSLRSIIAGNDTSALEGEGHWPPEAEQTVRKAVEKWLTTNGFPVTGGVRGRIIYPEGLLFKFGAAGIYWPFVGEGNIEGALHPLRKLPSMAHEMSHGYGFCDEGVCNFIAYQACSGAEDPYLSYCARLDYWSTLANACLSTDVERYDRDFRPYIPRGMVADIHAIRRQHARFKEFAPQLRYKVYDAYLKSQGIASGMLNYDEVLLLVHAWRKKHG